LRRIEKLKVQIRAVDLLRLLHRRFSYHELEDLIGIPKSVIALYSTGARVPTPENASMIIDRILEKVNPATLIMSKLGNLRGMSDWQELVLDPLVLKITSTWVLRHYGDSGINKVLSAETVGVPLATAISLDLEADLVLARRAPEDPTKEYIRGEAGEPPFNMKTFYVLKGSITKADQVLLVDDLARTGMTLEALAKIVRSVGAKIVAALVIVALGRSWRMRLEKLGVRNLHSFMEIV
jgi:adenine/guanine phosphoribosyltransferase-like PRPP-binding protein